MEKTELETYTSRQLTAEVLALAHYVNDCTHDQVAPSLPHKELGDIVKRIEILATRKETAESILSSPRS